MVELKKSFFDHQAIELAWQQVWAKINLYSPDLDHAKKPFYNLMMFPYPSAEGLHVGNMYAFTGVDVYGRFKRMQGYDVFEPIGLDGFGIHSENYALKVNRHPKEQAVISQKHFYKQLQSIGNGFDWQKTLETYDPDYYKWTQWLFAQMFTNGLAYKAAAPVNWCPGCKTVLADEQVLKRSVESRSMNNELGKKGDIRFKNGDLGKNEETVNTESEIMVCERCGSEVEMRKLSQWFFRIASGVRPNGIPYPDALVSNLNTIDWVDKVKIGQQNWIGKKEGINIRYAIVGSSHALIENDKDQLFVECFTTRPDTNFGATFIVIGPEHPLVAKIIAGELPFSISTSNEVKTYVEKSLKKTKEERIAEGKKKSGVFTGLYAINNLNGDHLPIWVSDFVIGDVGTGAVVGVPGHDLRDFQFAQTFNIPVRRVVVGKDGDTSLITREDQVQEEAGVMINSDFLDGMDIHEATKKIMDYLEKMGWGKRVVHYHLRDWLLSRQRYWGAPIPLVFCQNCAVREKKPYTVMVLHGTGGSSSSNWFPWLKQTLTENGVRVVVPDLPDEVPDYEMRMSFLEKEYGSILNEDLVVVGHSSGALTALHLAEKYPLRKVILVAPVSFVDDAYEMTLTGYFTSDIVKALRVLADRPLDNISIEAHVANVVALFGQDDPYLPQESISRLLHRVPKAQIQVFPGMKHFSKDTGDGDEFSALLRYLPDLSLAGWHVVPEEQLPVLLPDVKDWKPMGTGKSPLANVASFVETACPVCGGKAERETDVCDTFLDSSWYFLRYPFVGDDREPFGSELYTKSKSLKNPKRLKLLKDDKNFTCDDPAMHITRQWLPVASYIGGAEHTVLHLLYARFVTMALHDMGYLDFEEPFTRFYAHGLIIKEGAKMSKSKGNIVVPDDYIARYGSDTLRTYLMFLGPFNQGGDFRDSGIAGMYRFTRRVWNLVCDYLEKSGQRTQSSPGLERMMHKTIKRVSGDIERLEYNTAIAAIMEYVNALIEAKNDLSSNTITVLLKLLAPFMPHMTEELYSRMNADNDSDKRRLQESVFEKQSSIHLASWPEVDPAMLEEADVTMIVQVNGKTRDTIVMEKADSQDQKIMEERAKQSQNVQRYLTEKPVRKVIFVPGRLVNFVV